MSSQQWSFDQPDRFIVGTIGAPGEREFYFQIRQKNLLVSLATEKSQAAALAERITTIIREIKKSAPLNAVNLLPLIHHFLRLKSLSALRTLTKLMMLTRDRWSKFTLTCLWR